MRVGVISRGSPDYLIDIVADGMIRLLGRSMVSLDYNVRAGSGPFVHLMDGFGGPEPFDIREADALVASNHSVAAMREWRRAAGSRRPVAFIDGNDGDIIHEDVAAEARVYFKREYMEGRAYPEAVRPLPFAAIPEDRPEEAHAMNPVVFMAGETHPFRGVVAEKLREMGHCPAPLRLAKADYNRRLAQSMVGVSARGVGWDTYRYWEIPYFGCALLSQRPQIVIPDNFVGDREAVFFGTPQEMAEKLARMISDPEGTRALAAEGRRACLERHLSVNRARTVLEALA